MVRNVQISNLHFILAPSTAHTQLLFFAVVEDMLWDGSSEARKHAVITVSDERASFAHLPLSLR